MPLSKLLFLIGIYSVISSKLVAQNHQNRIGFGIDYIALDLPDDLTFSPHLDYERKCTDIFFLSGKFGFIHYNDKDTFTQTIPEYRNRIMFDIEGKVALLKLRGNYLKFGAGPCVWYRNDDLVRRVSFMLDNQATIINYEKETIKEVNSGIKLGAELDIHVLKNISLVGKIGFAHFKNAGTNSIAGLSALVSLK